MLEDIAERVSKRAHMRCDIRSVLRVMDALRKTNNIWMVVALSHEPFVLVIEILRVLSDAGLVRFDGEVRLTQEGLKLLDQHGYFASNNRCEYCGGRGVIIDRLPEDIVEVYLNAIAGRPKPLQEYDQGFVTYDSALARVAFMDQNGDIRGRRILLIGDDDLLSVAIGLLGGAKRITVIEIDERLTNYISRIAKDHGFDVEILTRDISEPLPEDMLNSFDTFHTDPPEPLEAIKLFVGRGIAALTKNRGAGYISLSLIDSSLYKWREVQKILLSEFRVVITDIIRDFNIYQNWEYIEQMKIWKLLPIKQMPPEGWYRTSLVRIETLEGSRGFNEKVEGDIYADIENISR